MLLLRRIIYVWNIADATLHILSYNIVTTSTLRRSNSVKNEEEIHNHGRGGKERCMECTPHTAQPTKSTSPKTTQFTSNLPCGLNQKEYIQNNHIKMSVNKL